ncbi:MAG: S41 family peptidase [Gemmatimonadales bacterium]|nr:S41 family peptidase [Gemmatimonadales bacterium]
MNRWGVTAMVAALSFLSGGWLLQRGTRQPGGPSAYESARLFDDVLSHVQNYYVDSLPEGDLYQKATNGLLGELKDPYSVLLQGDDYRALTEQTTGNYAGLGIQIDVRDGWITVVAPLPESPAERAGIETGDQIVEVDGKSTEGWKNDQAVKTLRGEPGSRVKIRVRRAGVTAPLAFELNRATIHMRSVPAGTLFDGGVGYVSMNGVSETSAAELRKEVMALRAKGAKSLVLDLRLNPGGLLDQGVKVADLFLDPKQEIVATRGRARGSSREYFDDAPQPWPDLPVVVLVNEGTASAAEIISGALQDHDRAVVVGTPTFGKGLVQTLFPIGEGTALKLTTAKWYTPSGRTIQRAARSEQEQMDVASGEAGGKAATTVDTSIKARPIFRTDMGRVVRGGGGIVPDMIVRPDTLSTGEREFAKALGEKLPVYRDVLTAYALALKEQKAIPSADFSVTPAMREELRTRLKAKGVDIDAKVWAGAGALIDEQFGYEAVRYSFGRPAESLRRFRDDPQMQAALGLLRKASTPKDLLQLANVPAAKSTARNN